jgi:hypothetical protein
VVNLSQIFSRKRQNPSSLPTVTTALIQCCSCLTNNPRSFAEVRRPRRCPPRCWIATRGHPHHWRVLAKPPHRRGLQPSPPVLILDLGKNHCGPRFVLSYSPSSLVWQSARAASLRQARRAPPLGASRHRRHRLEPSWAVHRVTNDLDYKGMILFRRSDLSRWSKNQRFWFNGVSWTHESAVVDLFHRVFFRKINL